MSKKKSIKTDGEYLYRCFEDHMEYLFQPKDAKKSVLTVLDFVTQSYRYSAQELFKELIKYKELQDIRSKVQLSKLYLPAMFCFRHYLELKIKCLYIWYAKEIPENTHKLKTLVEQLKETREFIIFDKIIEEIEKQEKLVSKTECFEEYFRYLTTKTYEYEDTLKIEFGKVEEYLELLTEIEYRVECIKLNDWIAEYITKPEEK